MPVLVIAAAASHAHADEQPPTPLLVEEWIADIPWHQKLSTTDSNLIDVPFVLPFEAIPAGLKGCENVTTETDEARCMLQHGIVNAMAIKRNDRLYAPGEAPEGQNCADGKCVQVKLEIQRLHTQTNESCQNWTDSSTTTSVACAPEEVANDPITLANSAPPSFGFAINEATVFAPWRPWYMGHYCGWGVVSVIDSVCYEAYFTTQLQAYTDTRNPNIAWPEDRGGYFFPTNPDNAPTGLYCREGENKCAMYLAQVDWSPANQNPPDDPNVEEFPVTGCDVTVQPCEKDLGALEAEVKEATDRLDDNFEAALAQFKDTGRFPWRMGEPHIPSASPESQNIPGTPYIGYYDLAWSQPPGSVTGEVVDTGKHHKGNLFQAAGYNVPKACTKGDFSKARQGEAESVEKLRDCSLTLEIHSVGFFEQWEHFFPAGTSKETIGELVNTANAEGMAASQYGRTLFFLAGLPEQKIAASFFSQDASWSNYPSGLSIYDQVYGSGPYTQYLPMVNPDGDIAPSNDGMPLQPDGTVKGMVQPYNDNMWHSFFMSNHMNQSPEHFIRGIRGRTLWHNEWRSNLMFKGYYESPTPNQTFTQKADAAGQGKLKDGASFDEQFAHRDFPAGFQPGDHQLPYHGNTCDSCHVRNGSGVPLAPNGFLSNIHTDRGIDPRFTLRGDYTYSNGYNPRRKDPKGRGNDPMIPSMKMVLFDLREPARRSAGFCDGDDHSVPASSDHAAGGFYNNKIMNFYGNSFHVNLEGEFPDPRLPTYDLRYVEIGSQDDQNAGAGEPFEIVDTTERLRLLPKPNSTMRTYTPMRAVVSGFQTGDRCTTDGDVEPFPPDAKDADWPTSCADVNGTQVGNAINVKQEVGYMHLLGKRLGNTPLIEMIPSKTIVETAKTQNRTLGGHAGCFQTSPGTRSGWSLTDTNYRDCRSGELGEDGLPVDCYIGRWGWIGNRASLEDQVANAAHVEQNITTRESYEAIHPNATSSAQLVRYNDDMCGPADEKCEFSPTVNSDLTEQEVRDMATYQRWIGIPQRSEFQVESEAVQDGERLFRSKELGCNYCHLIDKIPFVENDNMLPDEERAKLKKLLITRGGETDYPFVSYLGTDLLMHDMGYLSQVAKGPEGATMRDPTTGKIYLKYQAYFQFIRTPPLKGLRFNRFVTDSHHNAAAASDPNGYEAQAGCDFLLHDGRACDAIEAAFLHDGPAVKGLNMIENLSNLAPEELDQLRAFLYSL